MISYKRGRSCLKKTDQTFFQRIEELLPSYKKAVVEGYEQTLNHIMEVLEEKKQEQQEETEEEQK